MKEHFDFAFEKAMMNEGGFLLHKNEGDRGGWTFAGIAENFWPNWKGWDLVKSGHTNDPTLTQLVKDFYRENFWKPMRLDEIRDRLVCYNLFDFGINTGHRKAVQYAQKVVGALEDGIIGPKTISLINEMPSEEFVLKYALAKIGRYVAITDSNRSQERFLRGWIKRTLNVAATS